MQVKACKHMEAPRACWPSLSSTKFLCDEGNPNSEIGWLTAFVTHMTWDDSLNFRNKRP